MNFSKKIRLEAAIKHKKIVFPEAGFSVRTMLAVKEIVKKGICKCILIGDESALCINYKNIIKKCIVINPKTSDLAEKVAKYIFEQRQDKGITYEQAQNLAQDQFYFATTLVALGIADGMVGGAEVSTATNLKPALQLIKGKNGLVSSYFIMNGKNNATDDLFFITDAALVESPTSSQLAQIAEMALGQYKLFKATDPKLAFLSYSTNKSAKSDMVEKVQNAYTQFMQKNVGVTAIGEVQLDSALFERVRKVKMPNSNFKGACDVFVMPDLNAGNICYKAIQYFGGIRAIGPITMGLNKPINDLSRGCSVDDIVDLAAITALQCED